MESWNFALQGNDSQNQAVTSFSKRCRGAVSDDAGIVNADFKPASWTHSGRMSQDVNATSLARSLLKKTRKGKDFSPNGRSEENQAPFQGAAS
jgi:hypothetical protein